MCALIPGKPQKFKFPNIVKTQYNPMFVWSLMFEVEPQNELKQP